MNPQIIKIWQISMYAIYVAVKFNNKCLSFLFIYPHLLSKRLPILPHPCSEAQGEFSPLPCREKLWHSLRNHKYKFLQQSIIRDTFLLHRLPDCCRHKSNWWDQEPQGRQRKCGTWNNQRLIKSYPGCNTNNWE